MRKELESKLNIKAYDIYGLTEICGPGVGGECECQNGTHLWEDHFFPEIVDPVTLEPVEPGQHGELVFTTLTKEGMPMIRYRTRDLTHLIYDKCECGRTAVRMGRILGRSDDMLIIRGVNVFPSQVESVILEMPEFEPHYLIVVDRVNNTDIPDSSRSASGVLFGRNEQDDCLEEENREPYAECNRFATRYKDCRAAQHRAEYG